MAVSATVAGVAAVSYVSARKDRKAAEKAADEEQKLADAALKADEKKLKIAAKKEKALNKASPSYGTDAQSRIAAERAYLRKGRRGRMASIKTKPLG